VTLAIRAALPDAAPDIAAMAEIRIRSWQAACGCYERMGFRADGAEHRFEVAGAALPEIRYRLAGT
jgi:hypothetical protein